MINLNRSRSCKCCKREKYRIQLAAPKPDDPDYKVAWCLTCDGPIPPKKEKAGL